MNISLRSRVKNNFTCQGPINIGVVFPAGWLGCEQILSIEKGIESYGFGIRWAKNYLTTHGYLCGDDEMRAQSLMDIWLDPEVDVIVCGKGGWGSARILPYLDFEKLNQQQKLFIGMSDITALHLAFKKKLSYSTILGPNLSLLFSPSENEESKKMRDDLFSFIKGEKINIDLKNSLWIKKGEIQGELIGGNLAIINSLIGTPWALETQNKVLLLEDINEPVYKIDRMLFQLKASGYLDGLKGVILASFHNCESHEDKIRLNDLFNFYFEKMDYPSLIGFPSGHISYQAPLILGDEIVIKPII